MPNETIPRQSQNAANDIKRREINKEYEDFRTRIENLKSQAINNCTNTITRIFDTKFGKIKVGLDFELAYLYGDQLPQLRGLHIDFIEETITINNKTYEYISGRAQLRGCQFFIIWSTWKSPNNQLTDSAHMKLTTEVCKLLLDFWRTEIEPYQANLVMNIEIINAMHKIDKVLPYRLTLSSEFRANSSLELKTS